MNSAAGTGSPASPPREPPQVASARRGRWTGVALFLVLLAVYSANRREVGAVDTIGNTLLPVAILRGDGLDLSRFLGPAAARGVLPYYAMRSDGRLVLRYPIVPALVALPTTAAQLLVLDHLSPGWEQDKRRVHLFLRRMAKNSAAVVAALTGALFYRLLLQLGLGSVAIPATVATALGSEIWVVASQSAWQHGPAALLLTVALLVLVAEPRPRWRLAVGGLAAAAAVGARPTMVFFALALALWVLVSERWRGLWFQLHAGVVAALLMDYNLTVFGSVLGGLQEVLQIGSGFSGVARSFSSRPLAGLAGTLVSPNRGLFVFTPWAILALVCLPVTARRMARFPVVAAALVSLIPFTALVAAWHGWWAGWSFGPRYWTEAMPLLGLALAFALGWARERSPAARGGFVAAIAIAVAVQAVGAFCYPSSWNRRPVNVNHRPARIWDWRDTELSRCLVEGAKRPALNYRIFADDRPAGRLVR